MENKLITRNAVLLTEKDPVERDGVRGGKLIPFRFNTRTDGNENGYVYDPGCFDAFIERYYEANGISPLFCIQHNENLDHIAGRVLSIESDDETGEIRGVAWLAPSCLHYDKVLEMIQDKIFTHVSDCEMFDKYEVLEDGRIRVIEASLIHVSLVTMPSDTGARIAANKKFTFGNGKAKAEAVAEDDFMG